MSAAERYLREALEKVAEAEDSTKFSEAVKLCKDATTRVVEARKKDPTAQVEFEDEVWDCDSVARRILFCDGTMRIAPNKGEETIKEGIDLLRKYLNYNPNSVQVHMELAKAYTRVAQRKNAIEFAKKATEIDPDDLDARALHRQIVDNRKLGTRESFKNYGFISFILAPLLGLYGIYAAFVTSFNFGATIVAIAFGIWWLGARKQNKQFDKAALANAGIPTINERAL